MPFLARYSGQLYAVFRVVFGLLFMTHGLQKLGFLGGQKVGAPLMMLAAGIETIGGLLIAVGLFAGIAAFIASGEMAFAYFMAHFPRSPWPWENGGEVAVLYCFAFLYIAAVGSGAGSVDRLRRAR